MDDLSGQQKRTGTDIVTRDKIINTAVEVFKRHGGVRIDSPTLKYLYDFELHARLRLFESTRRWLVNNSLAEPAKCYTIGESVQDDDDEDTWDGTEGMFFHDTGNHTCDLIILGIFEDMLPDAEVLRALIEILSKVDLEDYKIRINHRKIVDGILESCGVARDNFQGITALVSPLRLKKEFQSDDDLLIEIERRLSQPGACLGKDASQLSRYFSRKGGRHLQYDLLLEEDLTANKTFFTGLCEMGLLFDYLEIFGVMDRIEFDLSFADFAETGIAFMAVAPVPIPESLSAGQIIEITEDFKEIACLATGGRDDSNKEKYGVQLAYFSLYVNEVSGSIKEKLSPQKGIRESETEVYVMSFGEGLLKERMQVCKQLWDEGVKAEFSYQKKPELAYQMTTARKSGIPLAIILSEEHLQQKKVKIVDLNLPEGHPQKTGIDVNFSDLVAEIKQRLERKQRSKGDDEVDDTDNENDEKNDNSTANGGNTFNENLKKVRLKGGTVDMEGIEIEMDFAKITSRCTQLEVQGAKIKMKNAKIELRGHKE